MNHQLQQEHMNDHQHIKCPRCHWLGTFDQCEERPGKFKGELHKWCPKCGKAKTFLVCPPPLEFPKIYPKDLRQLPALSIRQPWAWLVASGFKDYENREWSRSNPGRKFRGRFLIHASQGCTGAEYWDSCRAARECYHRETGGEIEIPPMIIMPRGCIIGAATVTGWCDEPPYDEPWAFTGGLQLEAPEIFEPIPCKGALGFFKPDLSALESGVKQS